MSWYQDCAGVTPEVGDYVAYNWAGDIAAGYVIGVGRKGRGPYRIAQVIPGNQENPSVVKRARSLLVLQKGSE